jgi:xylan 1,4-beta-xylosidase
MMKNIFELADREKANIAGMLTWAFEFENQPWFDGFRALATNGVDKPVLNVFRMAGLMGGERIGVESDGRVPLDQILADGVRERPDVDALATRSESGVSVLAWNYHDADVPAGPAQVRIILSGVPASVHRVLVRHYRIDDEHSNAWSAWRAAGSPQHPSADQYARLEAAGQLQLLESPHWMDAKNGDAILTFPLPRPAVSLIQIDWR